MMARAALSGRGRGGRLVSGLGLLETPVDQPRGGAMLAVGDTGL